jgi:hypothetical protein
VSSPSVVSAATLQVIPVSAGKDLDRFIALPRSLYAGDSSWIAPLLYTEKRRFSAKHNAFFKHADVQLFLALQDGRPVGRITAQVDSEHNRFHNERTGFFGFFESTDDTAVADGLLAAAEDWLRERGMERIRGPMNFSANGEIGFLVEGFGRPPKPLMPYTLPYYPRLMEGAGYQPVKDLYAWMWQREPVPDGPPRRMVDELRSRPDITIRRARKKDFRQEVATILELYNDAWSENWGFVPATEAEADEMAAELKLIVDPRIVPIVEVNGVAAGVALAVPDYYWAMQPLNGHLFPFGWLRFFWRLKVRGPESGRLLLLGIKKEFRSREYAGLAYLLCDEIYRGALEAGFQWAEFGWTLEDNHLINSLIKKIGCRHYKTYRLYEKALP